MLFRSLELSWGKPGWHDATRNLPGDAVQAHATFGFIDLAQRAARETVILDIVKSTVIRQMADPACKLGSVVALSAEKARPSELIVGVVSAAAQLLDTELSPPSATRVTFDAWPDKGRAVVVLLPDTLAYEPAYCLFHEHDESRLMGADAGLEPPAIVMGTTLVLPAGRCIALPCEVLVRDSGNVVKAHLALKLDGNAHFERFVMKML